MCGHMARWGTTMYAAGPCIACMSWCGSLCIHFIRFLVGLAIGHPAVDFPVSMLSIHPGVHAVWTSHIVLLRVAISACAHGCAHQPERVTAGRPRPGTTSGKHTYTYTADHKGKARIPQTGNIIKNTETTTSIIGKKTLSEQCMLAV